MPGPVPVPLRVVSRTPYTRPRTCGLCRGGSDLIPLSARHTCIEELSEESDVEIVEDAAAGCVADAFAAVPWFMNLSGLVNDAAKTRVAKDITVTTM